MDFCHVKEKGNQQIQKGVDTCEHSVWKDSVSTGVERDSNISFWICITNIYSHGPLTLRVVNSRFHQVLIRCHLSFSRYAFLSDYLTDLSCTEQNKFRQKLPQWDLNLQPSDHQSHALPTELERNLLDIFEVSFPLFHAPLYMFISRINRAGLYIGLNDSHPQWSSDLFLMKFILFCVTSDLSVILTEMCQIFLPWKTRMFFIYQSMRPKTFKFHDFPLSVYSINDFTPSGFIT